MLPPHDAAGLLGGARYHGRNTPLKAKAAGPPEGREDANSRMHLNRHSPYSPWLKRRDVMGQAGFTGMQDETQCKASKRTYAAAAASARRGYGAAAAVVAPDVARRKLLGQGTPPASARVVTHLRVMCVGTGLTQADVDPGTFQLDARRTPAPQTSAQRPGTAAAAYGDARSDYYTNRVRADGVNNILGCQALEL
ncbi:hypothetical protein WJX75_008312 [Coccomyxa subellipsoidea]|uniref:Uncharacterized protein n=1 Tax=Coccomyxa subellipsoidea TaxID=248742 RepID=A0ABR2YQE8_9CHLO